MANLQCPSGRTLQLLAILLLTIYSTSLECSSEIITSSNSNNEAPGLVQERDSPQQLQGVLAQSTDEKALAIASISKSPAIIDVSASNRASETSKEAAAQDENVEKPATSAKVQEAILEKTAEDDKQGNFLSRYLKPQTKLASLIYDDAYIRNLLDDRYPYLKRANATYLGIRDYFNYDEVFWPSDEYLEQRNIEQVLYEEMRGLELTSGYPVFDTYLYTDEQALRASGGPKRNVERCRASIAKLESELEEAARDPHRLFAPGTRNMELLRWIDAWGRPVSETYQGSNSWKGSYRGCRLVELELNLEDQEEEGGGKSNPTRFNYCWAKLAPRDWPANDVMRPRMSIKVGVCLPESCDTLEARAMLPRILKMMHFNFAPMYRERFSRILDIYCLPAQPEATNEIPVSSQQIAVGTEDASSSSSSFGGSLPLVGGWPLPARNFTLATLAWLLLIALCSLREYCAATGNDDQPQQATTWMSLLSFQHNYQAFVADDAPPANSRIDLRTLGLPRLFSSILVVVGHCFIHSYYTPTTPRFHILISRKLVWHLFALTWKSVEIFFVLSGILTSYSILNKFAPKKQMSAIIKPKVYLSLQLIRFLRVAPLMMFMWAFVRTCFLHFGEGPFWDYGTNKHTFMGQCQRISWWRWLIWPIIADVNGRHGDPYQHECLSVSWFVVTELKMFLAVPLYIYAIYRWPRARWHVLAATVAFSTAWKCAHLHLQQLVHLRQIFSYGEMHAIHIFITFLDSAYYSPIDRFQALALGLTGGFYLYKYKTSPKLKRWPLWMRSKLTTGLLFAWLAYDTVRRLLDEVRFRQTGEIPSDAYIGFWLIARPRIDAAIATLLTLRLCTDWAPALMRHSLVFYRISKISYCVYVLHSLIIQWAVSGHEHARPDSTATHLLTLVCFVLALSFLIAFPLYLLFESPVTLVTNYFVMGLRSRPTAAGGASAKSKARSMMKAQGKAVAAAATNAKSKAAGDDSSRRKNLSVSDFDLAAADKKAN